MEPLSRCSCGSPTMSCPGGGMPAGSKRDGSFASGESFGSFWGIDTL